MGQYFYHDLAEGGGFEAVFIEIGPHLEGSILDHGQLGEAIVNGTFSYPQLRFTKRYHDRTCEPVEYTGSMNEDGTVISGRWLIKAPASFSAGDYGGAGEITSGTWIATRGDSGEEFKFDVLEHEDDLDQAEKKEDVHVLTQPA
jgi:hypothetical protein